jgi:3'-phosphoadenosine 5'-phosphosulfate sulfotransferase (PAPS reductase)/FAD synthetase
MRYALFSSYGNDSVALMQLIHEHGLANQTYVVYTNRVRLQAPR